jgi:hypothetical protein
MYVDIDIYIYIWKGHKETPCIAFLNKQNIILSFFFSYKISENRRAEQVLLGRVGIGWSREDVGKW